MSDMTMEIAAKLNFSLEGIQTEQKRTEGFNAAVKTLAAAYSLPDKIWSNQAAAKRLEAGKSVNTAEAFLSQVEFDPEKANKGIEQLFSGKSGRIGGLIQGDLKNYDANSDSSDRYGVMAVLAHRAARLTVLLNGEEKGIPDAYATAQGQVRRALKITKQAAEIAYNWNADKNVPISVQEVLNTTAGRLTRKRITTGVLTGALVLAGCQIPVNSDAEIPLPQKQPSASEQAEIPAVPTKIVTEIPVMIAVESPTAVTTAESDQLQYPTKFSEWDYVKGSGGSELQKRDQIAAVAGADLSFMESNWISKMWRLGVVRADTYEQAESRFESQFEFVYGLTESAWTAVPREKSSGKLWFATGTNDLPFAQLAPFGISNIDNFEVTAMELAEDGLKQVLVPSKDGHFFTVVTIDKEGNPLGWLDLRDGLVQSVELPEELQKLQERLGNSYSLKLADVAEGEVAYYEIVDAAGQKVDGVKVFEDGSTDKAVQFRGKETTLVTSINAVSAGEDGGLDWGIFTLKDGEWRIVTDGVPATAEARQNFRKMVIIDGHAKEAEMLKSVHIANMMALEPVDLPGQFKGIVVDDPYRKKFENVDVTPEYYLIVNTGFGIAYFGLSSQFLTEADNRFNARNPQMEPMRIVKEAGFFNIEVVDLSGQVIHDLMNVPVVGLNSDGTCIPLHGVMNQEGLTQMIDLLNQDYKVPQITILMPLYLVGTSGDLVVVDENGNEIKRSWYSKFEYQLASDEALREYLAKVNHDYFVNHKNDGESTKGVKHKNIKNLPEDLREKFLEMMLIYAQSD